MNRFKSGLGAVTSWFGGAALCVPLTQAPSSGDVWERVDSASSRTIELGADQPALAPHGASRSLQLELGFQGRLYVFTEIGPVDSYVRAEDEHGVLLLEGSDTGGGGQAWMVLDSEPGKRIVVRVAASKPATFGSVQLLLRPAPDTAATTAAVERGRAALREIEALRGSGEWDRAREVLVAAKDDLLGCDGSTASEQIVEVVRDLAPVAFELADLDAALALAVRVREHDDLYLPEIHAARAAGLGNLAIVLKKRGDLKRAVEVEREALRIQSQTLPADHRDLQASRFNHSLTLGRLGDWAGARVLQEQSLAVLERTCPADDLELLTVCEGLSNSLRELGEYAAAKTLGLRALDGYTRTLGLDHDYVLHSSQSLGVTLKMLGDFEGARHLEERALAELMRRLPEDSLDLQTARGDLSNTLSSLGDLSGARELREKVVEVFQRTLPEDDPLTLSARTSLALALDKSGQHEAAVAELESVVATLERLSSKDESMLVTARSGLAVSLKALGRWSEARALDESVVAMLEKSLGADHPLVHDARLGLALTLGAEGDLARSAALTEESAAALARMYPPDHPDVLMAHSQLARCRAQAGDRVGTVQALESLIEGLSLAVQSAAWTRSARELDEFAASHEAALSVVLSLTAGTGSIAPLTELDPRVFEIVESLRGLGLRHSELALATRDVAELDPVRADLRARSAELARISQSAADPNGEREVRRDIERLQRQLASHVARDATARDDLAPPSASAIGAGLAADEALVAYRSYPRSRFSAEEPRTESIVPSLCAFVVRPPARVVRIELGDLDVVESAVGRWRSAVASHEAIGRGIPAGVPAAEAPSEDLAAAELCRLVIDPLRAAVADAHRWFVVLDDALHLVPLDALPDGAGCVGDRLDICARTTASEILSPKRPHTPADRLFAIGGIDYDATDAAGSGRAAPLVVAAIPAAGASAAWLRSTERSSAFGPLPATALEVRGIAGIRSGTLSDEAHTTVLDGRAATYRALVEGAPGARWIHLATHGFFAPDTVPSLDDLRRAGSSPLFRTRGERVRGLSPMLLAGLALSGANSSTDTLGNMPGTITAQEIAALDLSACELAVLSACDTSVGVRRAGQGVASLQRALQMAGARSAITSLWKVPDVATGELMVDFYRRLWVEKKPKHQALWEAKTTLRQAKDERGAPLYTTLDWAAWVLTGDPD